MTIIHVPRPPKSSLNLDRPASSLLLTQVDHMHAAEKRLPIRYRTDIYVNAIKTEGEAAKYISEVTTAIYRAHEDAAKRRGQRNSSQTAKRQGTTAARKKASPKLESKPVVKENARRVRSKN